MSRESAEEDYGVLLGDDGSVDTEATDERRRTMRNLRIGELPQFDRGPLASLDEQRRIIATTRREFNEWLSGELGGKGG